jgi:hypothetical protein
MHMVYALDLIEKEVQRTSDKHALMNSHHEAYGVISEEFNVEYWAEVCKGGGTPRDPNGLILELTHTAAMCVRALMDLC